MSSGTSAAPRNAFLHLLSDLRPELERRIKARFEEKSSRARTYGADVAAMIDAACDLTLRGGKRMRAGLVAAGWIAANGNVGAQTSSSARDWTGCIDGGVALELLQTYLLIQDDWMDGDLQRRGGPSVHAALQKTLRDEKLGAASAILASDMTWGLAIDTLSSIEAITPERRIKTLSLFMKVHEDVVLGQQIDMLGKAEDVEAMHDLKTGSYTIRGPLLLGATMAGANADLLASLERFAAPLGIAFQLRDDLLGTFGDPKETGKPVGSDIVAGKRTALVVEAEKLVNDIERSAFASAHGRADADEEAIRLATRALVTSGARSAVETRQRALCDDAEAIVRSMQISEHAREILVGVVEALRVRQSETEARS